MNPLKGLSMLPLFNPSRMAASLAARSSSRSFLLPSIPELFNPNFLDALVPEQAPISNEPQVQLHAAPSNLMIDALKSTGRQILTENMAPAYSGTDSATVNAFSGINRYTTRAQLNSFLRNSWKEDANLTLRIIWNLRSIHDGKGEKEVFYRSVPPFHRIFDSFLTYSIL